MVICFDRCEESQILLKTDLKIKSQTLKRFHHNFRIVLFFFRKRFYFKTWCAYSFEKITKTERNLDFEIRDIIVKIFCLLII